MKDMETPNFDRTTMLLNYLCLNGFWKFYFGGVNFPMEKVKGRRDGIIYGLLKYINDLIAEISSNRSLRKGFQYKGGNSIKG